MDQEKSSSDAIRSLLWSPGELGIARAYITGELQLEGDLYTVLRLLHNAAPADLHLGDRFLLALASIIHAAA